jgi:hypothetical protein
MTKKIFFSTLLIIVSAVVISACLPKKQDSGSENENQKQTKEMVMKKDGSFKGSLKDLISFGKPQKCTWQEGTEGTSGVTYTDGKRSYSEIKNVSITDFKGMGMNEEPMVGEPEKGSMYTMYDGEYVYTWSSASKEGLKIKDMDEDPTEGIENDDHEDYMPENEDNSEYLKTMESEIDYKCDSWKLDKSKFDLPKGIEFKDFSEMMGELEKSFGNMSDVCSMLDGEDQEECIADWAKAQEQMKKMGQ